MDELANRGMDNQNTNQNEACVTPACIEVDISVENGVSGASDADSVVSEAAQPDEVKSDPIPSIVITPPTEDKEIMANKVTEIIAVSMDDSHIEEVTHSEQKEEEKPLEVASAVDTASDDDFEVICRCSSTPVSANNESQTCVSSPDKYGAAHVQEENAPRDGEQKEGDVHECIPNEAVSAARAQTVVYIQPQCFQQENNDGASLSVPSQEYATVHVTGTAAYDLGSVATFAQQAPVYSVSNSAVTYLSAQPSVAGTYSSFQQDGVCQAPIPNGYYAGGYVTRPDQSLMDSAQLGEVLASPNMDCGAQNHGDPSSTNFQHPPTEIQNFIYPSIYVSNAGLISVLLRHDMSVEMTVDRTIRVVSHQHMMAVATDSRGTSACLYHPALKVMQQGTTTDISTEAVRVHMGHDEVAFAVGNSKYRFDMHEVQPAPHAKFSDISKDQSVNLLFSSEGYGESLVPQCLEVASKAEYANLPKGGVIVRINGVKVTQNGGGDVTVVTGAKFIRLSPSFGMTRLGNRFIDIEIERDWSSRVSRGPHCFLAGDRRFIISNGKLEVGVNEQGRFKVTQLQPHRPATPQQCLHPEQLARRVSSVTCTSSSSPRPSSVARAQSSRRRSAPVAVSR